MEEDKLGVVVVGIGRAGRARVRDLMKCADFDETRGARLIGYISRRELEIDGATQLTLENALKRNDVNIVIVCSENEQHEETARRSIEAGKHVLVEYPLAPTAAAAQKLYALADTHKVLLYEEDISMLTDSFKALRKMIEEKPKVTEGKSTLEARFNGWIENVDKSGSLFHSSVNKLRRLKTLFPGITAKEAHMIHNDKFRAAYAQLETVGGGIITLSIEREVLETPKRVVGFLYKFEDGTEVDNSTLSAAQGKPAPDLPGLFMKDFMQFLQVVKKQIPEEALRTLTLTSLQLAHQLYDMAKNNPKSQL